MRCPRPATRAAVAAVVASVALTGARPAPAEPPTGLAGSYDFEGVNRDGSKYSGELAITELGSGLYWLNWRDQDAHYTGKGALVGRTLYAVWGSKEARCLVAFFDRGAEGGLEGFWFRANDRDPASSTVTAEPLDAGDGIAGSYAVTSAGPASGLPPRLEVADLGDGYYRFAWPGGEALEGIGVSVEGQIQVVASVASHKGQCGKSEMELAADGSLAGTWMMNDQDYRKLGRESASRRPPRPE